MPLWIILAIAFASSFVTVGLLAEWLARRVRRSVLYETDGEVIGAPGEERGRSPPDAP